MPLVVEDKEYNKQNYKDRTLQAMGQAQAQGFQTALGAAQTQRQQQLAGGQLLGQLGAQQQAMVISGY